MQFANVPEQTDRSNSCLLRAISLGFTVSGVFLAIQGKPIGWGCAVFFGACLLIFQFEHKLLPDETTKRMPVTGLIVGFIGSVLLALASYWMAKDGYWVGWLGVLTFGLCACGYLIAPLRSTHVSAPTGAYRVVVDEGSVGCEYPSGDSEHFLWTEVTKVMIATTDSGPWLNDMWLFFFGPDGRECPIPIDAEGFDRLFDFLRIKLPGFDFEPFIVAGTDVETYMCWEQAKQD